jgi:predicted acetyltransferase
MNAVHIRPVTADEKPALWDMLQDYIGELSAYTGGKPTDGLYPYEYFDPYWTDANRSPFWAAAGDQHIGFALVYREENGEMRMAEFYIQPEYRRNGCGRDFARQLLLRFPGPWRIRQIALNRPAVTFWHRVLESWTYSEAHFRADGLERFEQSVVVS